MYIKNKWDTTLHHQTGKSNLSISTVDKNVVELEFLDTARVSEISTIYLENNLAVSSKIEITRTMGSQPNIYTWETLA